MKLLGWCLGSRSFSVKRLGSGSRSFSSEKIGLVFGVKFFLFCF